ncbi:nucleoid-associated protein [Pseudomonas graminis]
MAQALEAVLTANQIKTLEIESFIFHIIQSEESEEPIYLDAVTLGDAQKKFFVDRLKECAKGTQYVFKDDTPHLKRCCEEMISEPSGFIVNSRSITSDFAGRHAGNTADGVFVVSVVKYLHAANEYKKLIFLVKLDKSATLSYSYKEENGKKIAIINEVPNALSESKQAVQKSALIDVSGNHAWHVLAFDRVKPTLSDYYRGFLGVIERQTDSALTKNTHQALRVWASRIPADLLDDGEDANTIAGRSLNYFEAHEHFNTEEYVSAVVRHANDEKKAQLTESLNEKLAEVGVAGQSFTLMPGSLSRKDKKQIYQTAEGVTIMFEGDVAAAGIHRQTLPDGKTKITIVTNELQVKG